MEHDVVVQEHEPLFTDDEPEVRNTMDVTRLIALIRGIEKRINYLKLQDTESRAFYADKISRCQEQMDMFKQSILAYLQHEGRHKIQTPAGTAFQKTYTKRTWPSDEVLVEWASACKPEAIRIIREPDKKLLAQHIKSTGEVPDGYSEEERVIVCIK